MLQEPIKFIKDNNQLKIVFYEEGKMDVIDVFLSGYTISEFKIHKSNLEEVCLFQLLLIYYNLSLWMN